MNRPLRGGVKADLTADDPSSTLEEVTATPSWHPTQHTTHTGREHAMTDLNQAVYDLARQAIQDDYGDRLQDVADLAEHLASRVSKIETSDSQMPDAVDVAQHVQPSDVADYIDLWSVAESVAENISLSDVADNLDYNLLVPQVARVVADNFDMEDLTEVVSSVVDQAVPEAVQAALDGVAQTDQVLAEQAVQIATLGAQVHAMRTDVATGLVPNAFVATPRFLRIGDLVRVPNASHGLERWDECVVQSITATGSDALDYAEARIKRNSDGVVFTVAGFDDVIVLERSVNE